MRFKAAVQALAVLAARDGACPSATIAEDVPGHAVHLRRILARLARCGIVLAPEGRAGGYRLARPPSDITLADIWTGVKLAGRDEDEAASADGADTPVCLSSVLDGITAEAERAELAVLARYSLADVLAKVNSDGG